MSITWNSADKAASITLDATGFIATANGTTGNKLVRTTGPLTGLQYFEINVLISASNNQGIGLQNLVNNTANVPAIAGYGDTNGLYYQAAGQIFYANSGVSRGTSPGTWATGSVIGVAFDATNKRAWFTLNGTTWNTGGTANPATGVGYIDLSSTSGSLYPFVEPYDANTSFWLNAGQETFVYSIPSGYSTPNAQNFNATGAAFRWNEADVGPTVTTDSTGLIVTQNVDQQNSTTRGTVGWTTGKLFFEVTPLSSGTTTGHGYNGTLIGVADLLAPRTQYPANTVHGVAYQGAGAVFTNAANVLTMPSYTTGDVIGVALDMVNKKVWFNKNNGQWNNASSATQNPATNTGGISLSALSGAVYPVWGGFYTNSQSSLNGGPTVYAPPSGFSTPVVVVSPTGARKPAHARFFLKKVQIQRRAYLSPVKGSLPDAAVIAPIGARKPAHARFFLKKLQHRPRDLRRRASFVVDAVAIIATPRRSAKRARLFELHKGSNFPYARVKRKLILSVVDDDDQSYVSVVS